MKSVFKFITLKIMIVAFCTFGTSSIFAQDLAKECETIYQSMFGDKDQSVARLEKAVTKAKEYLEKCGNVKGQEEVKAYIEKQLPNIQKLLNERIWQRDVIEPFNASVPAKDWDKTFSLGKQILIKNPEFLDVILVLASIGFDLSTANPPNDKFNSDTINLAKTAIQKLNEGKPSESGNFGAFSYVYKTKNCADGKTNAIGWMNYTIGNITFYRLKNPKDAAPYLYKATQVGCETKNFSYIYRLIGDWYLDEFLKLDNSRAEKIKATGDKETAETKLILALQEGYLERALDAYARAYKIASRRDHYPSSLLQKVKNLYSSLYNGDLTGLNLYLKNVMDTPFVDPATPITLLPKN